MKGASRRLVLLLPLAWLATCGGSGRPNIVLVVVDTLRADHTTPYGYERGTTPALAELARRGVLFERAWSQAPWTLPSMTSLFTGRYVLRNYASIPPDATTLAERLAAAGYDTAAVVANPLLFEGSGFERGFRRFAVAALKKGRKTMRAVDVTRRLRDWLPKLREPFFLWVQLYDPHFPYSPPRRLAFEPGEADEALVADLRARQPSFAPERIELEDAQNVLDVVAAYDGEVRFADEALSDLLAGLQERGLPERTLVCVTADHGEGLFAHAEAPTAGEKTRYGLYVAHGEQAYEEALHVPLVLYGPGFVGGMRRTDLAANVDLYPTLLATAGLPPDPGAAGVDLHRPSGRAALFAFGTRAHAVRTQDDLKLVHPVRPRPEEGGGLPLHLLDVDPPPGRPVLLFDLAADPGERRNLAAERPADVERLRRLLLAWQDAQRRALGRSDPASAEMRRRLRELGYTR